MAVTNTPSNGLFFFAQRTLPQLLASVGAAPPPPHPPTLIVTGATASIRGSAKFTTFAAGKFAQRGITQSLAREFGPQGVHVAYAIIDGGIDTPWGRDLFGPPKTEDSKISPDAVSGFLFTTFFCVVLWISGANMMIDCRELLVPSHAAQIGLYAGAGPPHICRKVLTLLPIQPVVNIENNA